MSDTAIVWVIIAFGIYFLYLLFGIKSYKDPQNPQPTCMKCEKGILPWIKPKDRVEEVEELLQKTVPLCPTCEAEYKAGKVSDPKRKRRAGHLESCNCELCGLGTPQTKFDDHPFYNSNLEPSLWSRLTSVEQEQEQQHSGTDRYDTRDAEFWASLGGLGTPQTKFDDHPFYNSNLEPSLWSRLTPVEQEQKPSWANRYATIRQREEAQQKSQPAFWTSLSGERFEQELAYIYSKMGYEVSLTPTTSDQGVDIVLSKGGKKIIVQCKAHKRPVGTSVVRDLYGTLINFQEAHPEADKAILASTAGFTSGVEEFVKDKPIRLISLEDIIHMQKTIKRR